MFEGAKTKGKLWLKPGVDVDVEILPSMQLWKGARPTSRAEGKICGKDLLDFYSSSPVIDPRHARRQK